MNKETIYKVFELSCWTALTCLLFFISALLIGGAYCSIHTSRHSVKTAEAVFEIEHKIKHKKYDLMCKKIELIEKQINKSDEHVLKIGW